MPDPRRINAFLISRPALLVGAACLVYAVFAQANRGFLLWAGATFALVAGLPVLLARLEEHMALHGTHPGLPPGSNPLHFLRQPGGQTYHAVATNGWHVQLENRPDAGWFMFAKGPDDEEAPVLGPCATLSGLLYELRATARRRSATLPSSLATALEADVAFGPGWNIIGLAEGGYAQRASTHDGQYRAFPGPELERKLFRRNHQHQG